MHSDKTSRLEPRNRRSSCGDPHPRARRGSRANRRDKRTGASEDSADRRKSARAREDKEGGRTVLSDEDMPRRCCTHQRRTSPEGTPRRRRIRARTHAHQRDHQHIYFPRHGGETGLGAGWYATAVHACGSRSHSLAPAYPHGHSDDDSAPFTTLRARVRDYGRKQRRIRTVDIAGTIRFPAPQTKPADTQLAGQYASKSTLMGRRRASELARPNAALP